jgi:hypothetical protein
MRRPVQPPEQPPIRWGLLVFMILLSFFIAYLKIVLK